MMGFERATISRAAAALRAGETSAVGLTRLCLARIERLDGLLNAFITVTAAAAIKQAERADRELAAGGDRGPLHGIPVAIKDLIDTGAYGPRMGPSTTPTMSLKRMRPWSSACARPAPCPWARPGCTNWRSARHR